MNRRSLIVYTAGPYSGDLEKNIATARAFAQQIWDAGFTCLCPHSNTANFSEDGPTSWADYLEGDLIMLSRCDAVFLLPGWRESKGAGAERKCAADWGLPIFENLNDLIQWSQDDHKPIRRKG